MQNKYYITSPIYYVNDIPHIGHAYTTIAVDVIARFKQLEGNEVFLLTGTDEHGQKIEKSAAARGLDPLSSVNMLSETFRNLMRRLNISNNDFIRTTETRHKKAVEHFWQQLIDDENIYLGKYSGWYAIRDEAYYDESELTEDKLAPTGAPVEWVEEPSYFFALSKWQEKLLEWYETHPDFIQPKSRRNEVISFVKGGLKDLSVSRTSFKWGIKVPGDETHIVYVWLDALTSYISALGYPSLEGNYRKFWPANAHIVGKDILRFHAVYWPAFLMAAGLELPKTVFAHGWWTNEGQKISKSIGNVIDPIKLVEEFGVDQVRYFLMREVIFGSDGNYSRTNLITRINSELVNKIGNLMQRTLAFIYKNNNGKVPSINDEFIDMAYQDSILVLAEKFVKENNELINSFDINGIIDNIISLTEEANIYIDRQAPWQLKKTNEQKMLEVLYILLETLRYIAIMLQPFIPASADKMLDQLGISKEKRRFEHLTRKDAILPGSTILEPSPIFPRLEL